MDHQQQLIDMVKRLETRTVRLIVCTLNILALSDHNLVSLTVILPGIDGADILDLLNDNLYFATEIFSNTTTKDHTRIPEVIASVCRHPDTDSRIHEGSGPSGKSGSSCQSAGTCRKSLPRGRRYHVE